MDSQILNSSVNTPSPSERAGPLTFAGVFGVTVATLMYEILLTRIFSVTLYYHFAFMAISIAMFGLTLGGIVVYLHPAYARASDALRLMGRSSLFFSVWMILGIVIHLFVPFHAEFSLRGLASITLTFASLSAAFVYGGICVCLALTKFPSNVSGLYAADLAGAATGCVVLIAVFKLTSGPGAVFVIALFAALSSAAFLFRERGERLFRTAVIVCAALALLVVASAFATGRGSPLLDLIWVKGDIEGAHVYETWNSFSRICVLGDPGVPISPVDEGTSPTYPTNTAVYALPLTIDADAETTLTAFSGDFNTVKYLKYDVKEIVHYIRPNSRVLIIGAGGGRDILAALAFDQPSVQAVEMNQDILSTLNRKFGDFTGHLDRNPRVTFINDEGRSYLARSRQKFDIIQASFIDTWAATAAGAFALSENGLYTIEAWKLFYSRLTPRGVISFSRWFVPGHPQETYRLTALAATTLEQVGIRNPREHMILVRNAWRHSHSRFQGGAATLLVSLSPFSDADVGTIESLASRMQFSIVLSPRQAADPIFADLASGRDFHDVIARVRWKIDPPTDNQPFFFQMGKIGDLFRLTPRSRSTNEVTDAAHLLGTLLLIVTGLTVLCIVLPLAVTVAPARWAGIWPDALYFAAIGMGFMLIEVSQMQRLMIFLGHPTYALSVVLFTLLLASGLGSFTTKGAADSSLRRGGAFRLGALLTALCAFGILTQPVLLRFESSTTPIRIAVGIGILFPLGFLMGMPFPLGMIAADRKNSRLTPWLWGINGGTSVCASVLAVVISVYAGISAAFWTGTAWYAVALIGFLQSPRPASGKPVPISTEAGSAEAPA